MAIMDAKLEFSDNQALKMASTGSTQTVGTNTIDLGAKELDIGAGTPLYLNIRIISAPGISAYVAATSYDSSCHFRLDGCDTLSVPNTGPRYMKTPHRLGLADLTAGKWIMRQALPVGIRSKHLRLVFALNRSTATTWGATTLGYFDAFINQAAPETDVGT